MGVQITLIRIPSMISAQVVDATSTSPTCKVLKLFNNFNIIQEGLVEVASTTCVDIIEEILIVVICTPFCTP